MKKAIIKTNKGDMKFDLFEDVAPKAVENFTTHAKEGYYNGLIFHRVIKDFMIQGGDPTGTGCGGESIWGKSFEDEFDLSARNYYGALEQLKDNGFPQEVIDTYKEKGGTPWLDFHHTVFGMITDGTDVLEDIAATKTGMNDKPVYDVVIDTIEIEE